MSITSKVRQSVVLTADGQVQKLISGSAANITKASILSIFVQSTAADGEVKLYNEIGSAKTAGKLIFHGKFGAGDNLEIYSDGTHSYIEEKNASGNFYIKAESFNASGLAAAKV